MATSFLHVTFEAIGTTWKIDFFEVVTSPDNLLNEIKARIDTFDRAYSRFREDSLVSKMARTAGTYELPEDAEPMMRLYESLHHITKGLVTPLIGQVLVDAGYDAQYSLQPKTLHVPPSWEEVLTYQPPHTLTLKQPALLDVGALGKGYLIDIIGELIWNKGYRSFCVDAGGDLFYRYAEHHTYRIGLEHPQNFQQVIGVAKISHGSLCGSAGNRRTWANFHHIINPKTLTSPREVLAVWVWAKNTLLADAMTTGLFFVSPETLLRYYAFEYVILNADLTVRRSPSFPGELFLEKT